MSQTFVVVIAIVPAVISTLVAFLAVRALGDLRETIKVSQYQYRDPYGERYSYYSPYAFEIQLRIDRYQDRFGVRLTPGARQMLLIPVVEAYERGDSPDLETVDRSINTIFSTLREESPRLPGEQGRAISVIRAFWRNFCNIPPFCSGNDRG